MARTELRKVDGEEVADGVLRFCDGVVNWYLIVDEDRLAAVDAGFPPDFDALMEALRRLDRAPSDVRDVILTHAHIDHIGFAERARTELGATVRCRSWPTR